MNKRLTILMSFAVVTSLFANTSIESHALVKKAKNLTTVD